jgi:hypothetical protein
MIFIVICLGLISRRMTDYIPDIVDLFLGDSLWSLMIFLLVRLIFWKQSIKYVSVTSILFCFFIEFSQIYRSEWIDMIRRTTLGGLILGYGFLWSDLAAYLFGVVLGAIIDKYFRKQ